MVPVQNRHAYPDWAPSRNGSRTTENGTKFQSHFWIARWPVHNNPVLPKTETLRAHGNIQVSADELSCSEGLPMGSMTSVREGPIAIRVRGQASKESLERKPDKRLRLIWIRAARQAVWVVKRPMGETNRRCNSKDAQMGLNAHSGRDPVARNIAA